MSVAMVSVDETLIPHVEIPLATEAAYPHVRELVKNLKHTKDRVVA